jgi:F420-dependent oxidoreductase-like protein
MAQAVGMRLRVFTEPQQGAAYATLLSVAQAAERLGFDGFFRSDHFLAMGIDGRPGPTDSWVTLAGLARETSRVRLGTLMTAATFRLPGPLAVAVAQVDQMSGGRVEFGFGTGWFEREHRAYGIPCGDVRERFDRFAEQLEIITGLWETPDGQAFSYRGRFYQLTDSPALPKPAQRPRPPVIIGGKGLTRTPRLAARHADEYNVAFLPAELTGQRFAAARQACAEAGRDPATLALSAVQVVCCGRDEAQIRRRAEAIGRDVDELRANGLCGTPAEVVDRAGPFAERGADRIYLQVLDLSDLDHLELIASAVAPQLAGA